MSAIQNMNHSRAPEQLKEKLTSLNKSVRGSLPVIDTRMVNDIYTLTMTSTDIAWNWSKSFSPLTY